MKYLKEFSLDERFDSVPTRGNMTSRERHDYDRGQQRNNPTHENKAKDKPKNFEMYADEIYDADGDLDRLIEILKKYTESKLNQAIEFLHAVYYVHPEYTVTSDIIEEPNKPHAKKILELGRIITEAGKKHDLI